MIWNSIGPYLKDYSKNGTGVEETISYTATASGNWSIRISRYVGEGPYNITLAVNYRLRLVLQASTYPPDGVTFWVDDTEYIAYSNAPVHITVFIGPHHIEEKQREGFEKEYAPDVWYYYYFLRWSDYVTDNPRNINLLQNSTYTACYVRSRYPILQMP